MSYIKLSGIIFIIVFSFYGYTNMDSNPRNVVTLNDDYNPIPSDKPMNMNKIKLEQSIQGDGYIIGPEISTGITGSYDYKTNSESVSYIQVNPNSPEMIYVVDMQSPIGDPVAIGPRRSKGNVSYNGGESWSSPIEVNPDAYTGWPNLKLTSDGKAIITNHNKSKITNAVINTGSIPGGLTLSGYLSPLPYGGWPQITVLNNGNIFLAKLPTGVNKIDTIYTSIFNPSNSLFTPPFPVYSTGVSGISGLRYNIDNNLQGRITLVVNPKIIEDTLGDNIVYQRTSTDNGITWGQLSPVYKPFRSGNDIIVEAGGSDFIYRSHTSGWYYALVCDAINNSFDSTRLYLIKPNGNKIKIVDRAMVNACKSNEFTKPFANVHNIDHPSLGWSQDGSMLYCAYSVLKKDTGTAGWNTRDIYMQYSTSDGETWSAPIQITNTPDIDEGYPSVSRWNKANTLRMVYMKDPGDGPASFNGSGITAPASVNSQIYRQITLTGVLNVTNPSEQTPNRFYLYQNYPNPFNPNTTIKYYLADNSTVSLKVYNINGQEVADLVNEVQKAGMYNIIFNGAELSSGIYYYKLKANNFTEMRKMILIK